MKFFDCNVHYGKVAGKTVTEPISDLCGVVRAMDKSGTDKAIVYRYEQLYGAAPDQGNRMLAEDLRDHPNIYGLWTIVPSDTLEMPNPSEILTHMQKERIIGWVAAPDRHRYAKMPFVLEDYWRIACDAGVPVFLRTENGYSLDDIARILIEYPTLTVVLSFDHIWPNDRFLRPFVRKFENVYLDISKVITAFGIESFVQIFGSTRLVYGSGFPESYMGAGMLQIVKADIVDIHKENIAYGNMERIIQGIRYDSK